MLQLILAYQATKDIKTRNLIATHYLYLAKNLATKTANSSTTKLDREELEQEASIELLESIDDYNPHKGTKFSTFAYSRITGRLQQFIRDKLNLIRIPQNLYALNGKINKARNVLTSQFKRQPEGEEIASFLGITMEDYNNAQIAMLANNSNIVLIDDTYNLEAPLTTSLLEEIEDSNTNVLLEKPGYRRSQWLSSNLNESSTPKQS